MPRVTHRFQLADRLSPTERVLVELVVRLVNPLRTHPTQVQAALTQQDIVTLLRQIVHDLGQEA